MHQALGELASSNEPMFMKDTLLPTLDRRRTVESAEPSAAPLTAALALGTNAAIAASDANWRIVSWKPSSSDESSATIGSAPLSAVLPVLLGSGRAVGDTMSVVDETGCGVGLDVGSTLEFTASICVAAMGDNNDCRRSS
jgi:hypothetical protein